MAIRDVEPKCFILSLFIRSDGVRFLLGSGAYEFKDSQQHFADNTIENDVVEVQGNDGYLLAGQVRRPGVQSFDGYVGDAGTSKTDVEGYRRDFFSFFRKNFTYKVIYVFSDGSAIQRKRGFLVDAPTIQELYQIYPEYHVALNFEDINYYYYNEDADGDEIYGKSAIIGLSVAASGGLVWDSVGAVSEAYPTGVDYSGAGFVWEAGGGGGPEVLAIDSIDDVYPLLTVTGPAENPTITNITTGSTFVYTGTVTASQVLKVDMMSQTAILNGTSVIGNVSGDWLYFRPGDNRVEYTTNNAGAPDALIEWQEIVG